MRRSGPAGCSDSLESQTELASPPRLIPPHRLQALAGGKGKRRDRAQAQLGQQLALGGDRHDVAGAEADRAVGGHQEMLADLDLAVARTDIGELAALDA